MDVRELLSQIPYLEIDKPKNRIKRIILFILLALLFLLFTVWLITISFKLKELTRYGYLGVFIATFLSAATILLPSPGWAVTIAAGSAFNPAFVALAAGLGASLGECTSYVIGYFGRTAILRSKSAAYLKAEGWVKRYGIFAVPVLSFIPLLPFDLIGIASGALGLPFWKFFIAVLIGRIPRAFIESYFGAGLAHLIRNIFFQ